MYHIKNDKRCRRSADAIGTALRDLLAGKSLNDITVTDLQKVSGVGRSTFYRLFDNIDDVLLYVVDERFRGLPDLYREMGWSEFTALLIKEIVSEGRELMNIAASGKMHILSLSLRKNLTQRAEEDNYEFDDTARYMIAMFVGGCISLVTVWDENGRVESIDELAALMQKAFNYRQMEETLTRPAKAAEKIYE